MNTSEQERGAGDRRGFLAKAVALLSAAAACAVPAGVAFGVFLDPWRRRGQSAAADAKAGAEAATGAKFIPVAALSALAVGGPPQEFPVVSTRQDAWTFSVEPIGRVFLVRNVPSEVKALQVLCPHAGCPVQFRPESGDFACTCHARPRFDRTGKRLDQDSFSPRDLDELEVQISPEGEVLVKYEMFRTGIAQRMAAS